MKVLWVAAGIFFLALGIAGIILPMMPGTIFIFIASACFLRGSDRLHRWLLAHPILGTHVRAVAEGAPMPRRAKIFAITTMWIAVTISIFMTRVIAAQVGLAALAVIGTWFISRR